MVTFVTTLLMIVFLWGIITNIAIVARGNPEQALVNFVGLIINVACVVGILFLAAV